MFGLIGHSTSFEDAKRKASMLGFDHIADGDLDVWCTAPPQLVENVEVKSATGISIEGSYIDSCFVPEMLSRFKTARRKVLNAMELAQKKGINITALGGFTSIIFENFNLLQHKQIRNTSLEWERFTTGNTHTAWVICKQLEINAPRIGIDLKKATVAVIGATGDIGSAVCRWLINKTGISELLMVARQQEPLALLQKELDGGTITSLDEALPQADIVVWVASMPKTIEIDTDNLKKPCLMIDGGYPKNLDEKFQGENIYVLKGGIVEFFNDIGWNMMELAEMQNPQREMFACFAEAMILEFEKCHTNFSWGRNNISLEKMEFIGAASLKHGFSAIGLDKQPKVLTV
ncbi:long-chain acyl-[acyl-carrier-protein] reductase [Prochlorococcus marinus]|jgi:fatty aldehyde-generating acyl-ACP reductase|uniref:Long-chain acyl-[acyl-carrier-protein] reductase n=1 Tax=Prochlorococcus marinus (strain MIT 9301) TaxID=167546 RepID=A3PBQ7_PROM0|nr:long-chain acyl-[acyl-carrier-protein] reductase [Prochlorococcus marinus]MCQ9204201.1 long-chain acyl-[acyl-carrier-protein] reductase [Prochlorococcus marinus CUG1436]MDA9721437.1 long-chain acyl-[acyl-carrier-protein] reductase [bacterium]ABO17182.1 Predicted dehydrogenase [Prochlorococcus marinus str. MIT 9301]MBO8220609.1 long-chain acyl-[acyl-carrier-protein] reductase [Prochlorococcus marinus CUG1417]MBW3075239.1 long-chain acyl-[acyl-carrier-protein] reductase [Prochlorococcus marin